MANIVNTLWIQNELDEFTKLCIESWVNVGYEVILWTYGEIEYNNPSVSIQDARIITPCRIDEDYAPMADIFRFTMAKKYSEVNETFTWLDSDLFLLRRIPYINIISSEHTKQKGAFKSIDKKVANIGCLQFLYDYKKINWEKILCKIERTKNTQNSNNNSYMKIFQKEVKGLDIIVEPNCFCPVSWANWKQIYSQMSCESKFGMNVIEDFYDFTTNKNIYGIHLWRNLHNKSNPMAHLSFGTPLPRLAEDWSLLDHLQNMTPSSLKFYVPTYKRLDILTTKSLSFLRQSFILKDNIIIVADFYDTSYDNLDYPLIKCPCRGIGETRSWILNECAESGDTLIMIDDDIEYLIDRESKKIYLNSIINNQIKEMKICGAYLSGFPLCSNTYFLKDNYTTNLNYISGAIQIHRVDHSKDIVETHLRHFEDFHFNILYFLRDGVILRNNRYAPITQNYNPNGGICAEYGSVEARLLDAQKVAKEMEQEYQGMCLAYYKNGRAGQPPCWNLRLNHNFKYG